MVEPHKSEQPTRTIERQLLSEVRRIKLRTRKRMNADLLGQYRSAFRGQGLVFSDIREYQPGDDVKHIHWKITARSASSKVFVKSYDEDRQLSIVLVLDMSRSTDYGSGKSKHESLLEFAALITMLARNSQDAVGMCMFSAGIDEFFPPSRRRSQFDRIFTSLLSSTSLRPATDLRAALAFLNERLRKPAIVFIVSDFYCAPFDHELRVLAARHDVICTMLEHDMDRNLPKAGIVEFIDAESGGRTLLDTSNTKVRDALIAAAERRRTILRNQSRACGADFMSLSGNPIQPLIQLMNTRKAHLR